MSIYCTIPSKNEKQIWLKIIHLFVIMKPSVDNNITVNIAELLFPDVLNMDMQVLIPLT